METLMRGFPLKNKIFSSKKLKEFLANDPDLKLITVKTENQTQSKDYNSIDQLEDNKYYRILYDRRIFIEVEEATVFD